jgi:hypothetical protein
VENSLFLSLVVTNEMLLKLQHGGCTVFAGERNSDIGINVPRKIATNQMIAGADTRSWTQ